MARGVLHEPNVAGRYVALAFTRRRADQHNPGLWDVLADAQARLAMYRAEDLLGRGRTRAVRSGKLVRLEGRHWPMSDGPYLGTAVVKAKKKLDAIGYLSWQQIREWANAVFPPDLADLLIFLGAQIQTLNSAYGRTMRIDLPDALWNLRSMAKKTSVDSLPPIPPAGWQPPE